MSGYSKPENHIRKQKTATKPNDNQGFFWHDRYYLPHLDAKGLAQFVTFRLYDAIPAEMIELWRQELNSQKEIASSPNKDVFLEKRIEQYTDSGKGSCFLKNERIAQIVQDALLNFDNNRYSLIVWCIMPNHVHVLTPIEKYSLSKIIHSWKSFTAHQANKVINRTGEFWQTEYYDRYIRNDKHLSAAVE